MDRKIRIRIKKESIESFQKFLYGIENLDDILSSREATDKHHSLITSMKVDLDHIKENWNIENVKISKGKSIKPFVDKNKFNRSFDDGNLNLRMVSSIICYFFHHFFNHYYFGGVEISELKKLELFFEDVEIDPNVKTPAREIEYLINYILNNHKDFTSGLNIKLSKSENSEVEKKYSFLDKITVGVAVNLDLTFLVSDSEGKISELFPKESKLTATYREIPDVYFEKTINSSDNLKGSEKREDLSSIYREKLRERFAFIRLDVVGFKMSINHFVKAPLLKKDLDSEKILKDLYNQKSRLELLDRPPKKELDRVKEQINKAQEILNKEYDIDDVIKIGKDIFIEAPAGTGKSTMLRWLTYKFSSYADSYFPVFIELMYNTEDNLLNLIKESCDYIEYKREIFQGKKGILFLDGFDQFNGNRIKLFRDISNLKQGNLQIVISGRQTPNLSKYNLDFIVYNLAPFNKNDIRKICISYLGKEDGSFYIDYFESRNLLRFINKPLYLCFILSHLNRLTQRNWDRSQIISTLNVTNKGKLLSDIIIDFFISEYEEDTFNFSNNDDYITTKIPQLKALNFLAHQMTIELKDTEVIPWEEAVNIIKDFYNSSPELNKIEPNTVLRQFIGHNILYLKKDILSFDRKELRLFFASQILKDKIKTFDDLKLERHLFFEKGGNENTWNSIKRYLAGMLDPDLIFSSFEIIDFNDFVFLDGIFLAQFELSLEFAHQDNLPIGSSPITKKYLVKLIRLIIEKFEDVSRYSKGTSTIFSLIPIGRLLIKKGLFPKKYITKELETRFNEHFFRFIYQIHLGGNHQKILRYLIYYDFGLTVKDILAITKNLRDNEFAQKRFFYDEILRGERSSIIFSVEEKCELTFNYLFLYDTINDYSEIIKYKSTRLNLFYGEILQKYSSQFMNFFFENIEIIPTYRISKFIYRLIVSPKNGYWVRFDDDILLSKNADIIISYFKTKFHNKEKYFYSIENLLLRSSNNYLKGLFLDYFFENLIDDKLSKVKRKNAFRYLFNGGRSKDFKTLTSVLQQGNKNVFEIVTDFFSKMRSENYITKQRTRDNSILEFYTIFLITDICDGRCKSSIIDLIRFSNQNNEKLDDIVIDIFDSMYDVHPVSSALSYFVKFNTIKAVPVIERYIKGFFGLQCFYTLTMLNPIFYDKYISLFQKAYEDSILFLKNLTEFTDDIEQAMQIFDLLYVGDKKMLELFQSKKSTFLGKRGNRYFYQATEKDLIKKCELLQIKTPQP